MYCLVLLTTAVALVCGHPGYSYTNPSRNSLDTNHFPRRNDEFFNHGTNGGSYAVHEDFSNSYDHIGYPHADNGPALVHKHIYVHVPPPQLEEEQPTSPPIKVPPASKHYKIIFIKAPTAPTPTAPTIPEIPQNEEKTFVYVLVKKPEDAPEIVIPTPPSTQPSKPEVYFIRYKAQKEEKDDEEKSEGYP